MSIAFGVAQCQQHKGHILHDLKVFTYWCCNYWVVVAQSSNCKLKCLHLTHALCMGFIPWSFWCFASCPKTFGTWNHAHHGPQFKDRGTPLQKKTGDPWSSWITIIMICLAPHKISCHFALFLLCLWWASVVSLVWKLLFKTCAPKPIPLQWNSDHRLLNPV